MNVGIFFLVVAVVMSLGMIGAVLLHAQTAKDIRASRERRMQHGVSDRDSSS